MKTRGPEGARKKIKSDDEIYPAEDEDDLDSKNFVKQLRTYVVHLSTAMDPPIITWQRSEDGLETFTLENADICEYAMRDFFHSSKFVSLTRQLNNYGFVRIVGPRKPGASVWFHALFTKAGGSDHLIVKEDPAMRMKQQHPRATRAGRPPKSQNRLPRGQAKAMKLARSAMRAVRAETTADGPGSEPVPRKRKPLRSAAPWAEPESEEAGGRFEPSEQHEMPLRALAHAALWAEGPGPFYGGPEPGRPMPYAPPWAEAAGHGNSTLGGMGPHSGFPFAPPWAGSAPGRGRFNEGRVLHEPHFPPRDVAEWAYSSESYYPGNGYLSARVMLPADTAASSEAQAPSWAEATPSLEPQPTHPRLDYEATRETGRSTPNMEHVEQRPFVPLPSVNTAPRQERWRMEEGPRGERYAQPMMYGAAEQQQQATARIADEFSQMPLHIMEHHWRQQHHFMVEQKIFRQQQIRLQQYARQQQTANIEARWQREQAQSLNMGLPASTSLSLVIQAALTSNGTLPADRSLLAETVEPNATARRDEQVLASSSPTATLRPPPAFDVYSFPPPPNPPPGLFPEKK